MRRLPIHPADRELATNAHHFPLSPDAPADHVTIGTMKKQTVLALVLLLLIPIVTVLGGVLFSLINPEMAAGHPQYARNFHLLTLLKYMSLWATAAVVAILWLLVCFLVVRSKQRSYWWLLLAALGPFGFIILVRLSDRTSGAADPYKKFVSGLNRFVRVGYEVCSFVILWLLAYEAMVLLRNLMIMVESATTGISAAQIIATQNASSGMWAFGEWLETLFIAVLLYMIWPIAFNIVARLAVSTVPRKAS